MKEVEQLQSTAGNVTNKVVTQVAQTVQNAAVNIFQKEADANVKALKDVTKQIIEEGKKIRERSNELLVKGEEVSKSFKELFPDVTDDELQKAASRSDEQIFADIQKSIAVTPEEQEKTKQEIERDYQQARAKYLAENGISNEFDDLPSDVRYEKLILQNMKPISEHQFDAEIMELAAAMNNFVAVKMQRYDAEIQRKLELEALERLRRAAREARERHDDDDDFLGTLFNIAKIAVVGAVAWFAPPLMPAVIPSILGTAAAVGAADAAMQGLGIALKVQDKFRVNEVLESGIMGGVTAATPGLGIVGRTGAVATSTAATEAIEVGLGMKKKFDVSNVAFQTAASVVASGLKEIIPEMIPEVVGAEGNHIAITVADTTVNSVINHAITGAPIDIGHIATNIAGNIAGKKLGETAVSLTNQPKPNFERTEASQQNKKDGRNKIADQKHFLSSADIDIAKALSSTCFLPEGLDANSPITSDIPIETEKTGSLSGFETLDKVTNAMTHSKPLFPSEWKVGTRAMGGLQAVGGVVESGIGLGCLRLGGANPAGILFCGSVLASGGDNIVTGAKTMVTGEHQETNFVRGAQKLGVDVSKASLAQTALDLATTVSPYGILKSSRIFSFFKPDKVGSVKFIKTPYGKAIQSEAPSALEAREAVEKGARIYRGGKLGRSGGPEAQFWSLENPLTPGYVDKYGIPIENVNFDFVEVAVLKPGSSFITREAPGIGLHGGGGIEVIVNPNVPKLEYFHMPWELEYDSIKHSFIPRNK